MDALQIVSLTLSGISTMTALYALRQFPRPYPSMRAWRNEQNREDRPLINLQLVLLGRTDAHDVRLRLHRGRDSVNLLYVTVLAVGATTAVSVSMVDGTVDREWGRDTYGGRVVPEGVPAQRLKLDIEVQWRQAPSMRRVRTKSFVLRIDGTSYDVWQQANWRRWHAAQWRWVLSSVSRRS